MSVELQNGKIMFYRNEAGYVEQGQAIVDPVFRCPELEDFIREQGLVAEWRPGVFEWLAFNMIAQPEAIKSCRIWQLKADVDPSLRFAELDKSRDYDGWPQRDNYRLAYDGSFGTNDPERIYSICQEQLPDDYDGHPLTVSDVVELYDNEDSRFYYADRVGFQEIHFE